MYKERIDITTVMWQRERTSSVRWRWEEAANKEDSWRWNDQEMPDLEDGLSSIGYKLQLGSRILTETKRLDLWFALNVVVVKGS